MLLPILLLPILLLTHLSPISNRDIPLRAAQANLLLMGLLDVVGYASFAAGLPLCGAALSSTLSAATSQLITALLSWAVLGRRLSKGQQASVSLSLHVDRHTGLIIRIS